MNDKITIYIFYLKSDKTMYACTSDKKLYKLFSSQRNMKKFIKRKVILHPKQFQGFKSNHSNKFLNEIPLNHTINDYVSLVATCDEESDLFLKCDEHDKTINLLYKFLILENEFKEKYKESIEYLCNIICYSENDNLTKDLVSRIDLFHVFIDIFKDTF